MTQFWNSSDCEKGITHSTGSHAHPRHVWCMMWYALACSMSILLSSDNSESNLSWTPLSLKMYLNVRSGLLCCQPFVHSWKCLLILSFDNNIPAFSRMFFIFVDVLKGIWPSRSLDFAELTSVLSSSLSLALSLFTECISLLIWPHLRFLLSLF